MTTDTPGQLCAPSAERSGGVTRRAVVLGLILLLAVAVFTYYVEMLWKAGWDLWLVSSGCPAMTPVLVLFLLTAVLRSSALGRFRFSRRELLVVYSIVLVGAPVVTYEVLAWVLVKSIHYYYMARVQPAWGAFFLQEVPSWFAPSDPAAVMGFFEGQSRVPWSLWWIPLGAWSGFMIALFAAGMCLMALVQRQWITGERLTFPIAQIPLTMIREADGADDTTPGRFTLARAFWIGAAVSFSLHLLSGLSERIPAIPTIPLGPIEVIPWQKVGPLAGLGSIYVLFWPWLCAIAYLIPKELSFSIWFFWLVRLALHVVAVMLGATPQRPEDWYGSSFPAPYYQGAGAILGMAGWILWAARRHLARGARSAVRFRADSEEANEPLSYRWAFLGLVLSCAFMVYFFWLARCRVIFGLTLIGLMLIYFTVWARIRAETGLGVLIFPIEIQDLVMVPFGSRIFRLRELVTLISARWAYSPGLDTSFEVFPGTILECYKIADSARINSRRLSAAIAAGFLLCLVVGTFMVLSGIYHHGWYGFGFTRSGWLVAQGTSDGNRIVSFLTDARYDETDVSGLAAIAAGAAAAVVLGVMRLRFWWWPFHPVGYLAANTWGLQLWCTPFLLGWACKTIIIRYAGLRLYRRTIPLAVGLIVGDLLNSGLWGILRVVRMGAY